ncbi:MAG: TVP38/TMEM64 family protein [Elusimicrobiota bacterium]
MNEGTRQVLQWVAGLGPWAPAAFVLLYAAATVLFLPGLLLTLGAGALFGLAKGTLVVTLGANLGASAAFLLARGAARGWVARKLAGRPGLAAVNEALKRDGWQVMLLLRLSPVVPFNALNYAAGLTELSLKDYVLASLLGMLPGTVLFVYAGTLAGDLARLSGGGRVRTRAEWALSLLGLLATIAAAALIAKRSKQALARRRISF